MLTDHFSWQKPVQIAIKRHGCDDLEVVMEKKSRISTSDQECIDETPPDPEFMPLSQIQSTYASKHIDVNMFKPERVQ